MNYRHHFHAGNFADVFKHVILICLLMHMHKKAAPFTYFDSHAGRGLYLLNNSDTQKSKEYQFGIEALFDYQKDHPAPEYIRQFLDIVEPYFQNSQNTNYPGSPKIAEQFMRSNDKMILCELHPEEFTLLKNNLHRNDKLITLNHMDAYTAIKGLIPFKHTTRGLLMIDPPFEKKDEFVKIENSMKESLKRWQQGSYMIWHPIKNKVEVTRFQKKIKAYADNTLCLEFFIKHKEINTSLIGCGVVLVNPPWKLEEELSSIALPYLSKALGGIFNIK